MAATNTKLFSLQVIIVAVPMLYLMSDLSADGRFLGSALILWTSPMTTMGLIFLPKMVAVHFPPDGVTKIRGSSGGTRISGLAPAQEAGQSESRHPQVTEQSDGSAPNQCAATVLNESTRLSYVTVQ
jgi:hypothetical protein